MATNVVKTSVDLDTSTLARLHEYKARTGITISRLVRAVLTLVPFWREDRIHVVLSIPTEATKDQATLTTWLDRAKAELIKQLTSGQ